LLSYIENGTEKKYIDAINKAIDVVKNKMRRKQTTTNVNKYRHN